MSGAVSNMQVAMQAPALAGGVLSPVGRLRSCGAYPIKVGGAWKLDLSPVSPVLDGYFERSNPHVYPSSFFGYGMFNYLINEHDFPSAIGSIEGVGGAYVGLGPIFGFTNAAWQGASHSWAIDCNRRVPFGFIPLYGALLATSRNRLEFLSLISGRPMSEELRLSNAGGATPAELVRLTKDVPYDDKFFNAVSSSFMGAVASRAPFADSMPIVEITAHWMHEFRKSFMPNGKDLQKMYGPHSVFVVTDSEGRGGTISSEDQFRRERDLFLEGRITGVAAEIAKEGLDVVERSMEEGRDAPKVFYISNVEDHFFINYEKGGILDQYGSYADIWDAVYVFYKRMREVMSAPDAMVVSALSLKRTTVQNSAQYVRNAIPLHRPIKEAAETAFDFYRFRRAVAREHRKPMSERIDLVQKAPEISERLRMVCGEMKAISNGKSLHIETVREHLSMASQEFRVLLRPWEREMFLRNMVDLGVIERPPRYQSFLNSIEAR